MPASAARAPGWLADRDCHLTLRATLLGLLLFPVGTSVRAATLVAAGAGLLHPGVLRSPLTWLLLTLLTSWRVLVLWPLADNHSFLLAYWCLAVTLSRVASDPARALALSARLLVALVFVFAAAWKLWLSDDFLDGTFFRVLLLGDRRFEDVSLLVGGLDRGSLAESRRFLAVGGGLGSGAGLVEPARLRALALALSWGAVLLESAIAIAFLAPLRSARVWLRHVLLLVFCAGTYALAPVAGFGWLLLTLGLTQCPAGSVRLRWAYLASFGLLVVEDALLRGRLGG